jgi:CRP-like cAMP-binding protein
MDTTVLKGPAQGERADALSTGILPKSARAGGTGPEIRARAAELPGAKTPFDNNLLSKAQQDQIRTIATVQHYRRSGEMIYTEGDEAQFVYFIDEGLIRISRLSENGHRQILAFRGHGDLFGLPDEKRYVNSAECVSPAKVFRCSWHLMQQLMLDEPQLQFMFFNKLANQVRDAQRRIMMLGQQNIYQRLASFIIEILDMPEFFDSQRMLLTLPVNRFDLADYLGTAPESTARAFARLERDALVKRLGSRTVEILDLPGLHAMQNGRRRAAAT